MRFQAGFGGTGQEVFSAFAPRTGGGALLGGWSDSAAGGNKTAPNYGGNDYWVVAIDPSGARQWDRSYKWDLNAAGNGNDYLHAMIQTADGGYLLAGESYLRRDTNSLPSLDFWVVRIDATGNKQWERIYGGVGSEYLGGASSTTDGGFLLVGTSDSPPDTNRTAVLRGRQDIWVVRIDAQGNKLWDRSYGGTNLAEGQCVVPTGDGGFLIGGSAWSGVSGTKTAPDYGDFDFWVVKIDSAGNQMWDKSFGGDSRDELSRLLPLVDGGFVLGGSTASGHSGNKTSTSFGDWDIWLVKIGANGNKQWEVQHGGNRGDVFCDIAPTIDGGFLATASSQSPPSGTKTAPYYPNPSDSGNANYWILKLDASGQREWDQSYGGSGNDIPKSVWPSGDGNFLLGGYSASGTNSSKTVASYGGSDWWVLKLIGTNLPTIVTQPQSGQFTSGQTVTLKVVVESFTRPTYQWRRETQDLIDRTNSTLVLVGMQSDDAGNYSCLVSNSFGSTPTMAATLTYTESASLQVTLNPLLTIFGAVGRTYGIEWTLTPGIPSSWVPLTNVTLSTSPQQWIDSRPTAQTNRFYRAILMP